MCSVCFNDNYKESRDMNNASKFSSKFNIEQIWQKLSKYAKLAGAKIVYIVLLMYYAFKRPDTPKWAKGAILGALAYFVSPIDFLPDLTPFLGFTDDMTVLIAGLLKVSQFINEDVKSKAKTKLGDWFDIAESNDVYVEIDSKLHEKT